MSQVTQGDASACAPQIVSDVTQVIQATQVFPVLPSISSALKLNPYATQLSEAQLIGGPRDEFHIKFVHLNRRASRTHVALYKKKAEHHESCKWPVFWRVGLQTTARSQSAVPFGMP